MIRQQVRWAYQGLKGTNNASFIVNEYSELALLRKLGFQFDGNDLSNFKAACFGIISSEIEVGREKELKKASRKNGHSN